MSGRVPAGVENEIQQMQDGVRDWVQHTARRGKGRLRAASPAIVLSLLCASAFCPLLLATGVAGAGLSVLSSVGGGFLTQVISDTLARLRQHGQARIPSRDDLEAGIAEQIQRVLAAGDERASALRSEIAAVLEEIDAGGTALRAAMQQSNERVRDEVIAAIGVLGSGFSELGFLIKDIARAAAEIQESLDVQGANVRAIIEQNARQSTDIRLVREGLAVIAERTRAGTPADAGGADGGPRWVRGCPYRGLLPFSETDAEVFYGRERLAAELAVKLAARVTSGGLVVVTGASGAGKSSLLRAGLLPILARGQQVQRSDQWPCIVMTPTKDPLTELAARLAALGGNDIVAVRDGLTQHPDQAHLAVWLAALAVAARLGEGQSASSDSGARVVLVVDQFEQVFTLNPGQGGEPARQAFVTALCTAATSPVGPRQEPAALVVIVVRGDFWDRCAAYPELVGALQDGQFVVGPMTESELRMTITGPADAARLRIEPALTDTILSDLRAAGGDGAAGVLPLLSQAMALTWEKREDDRLTSHGYGQTGGVSHAVQTGADRVYDALPTGQQALAREMLRSMTVASRDGRLTRRPLTRADLYSGLPGADQSQVDAVLEAFAAERLIVLAEDTAQISHDVLLQAWPKLRAWLEEDQASWILYGQLADATTAWHERSDDPSFLYRGTHLSALQQAVKRWSADPARYPALTGTQRNFLHASERAAARASRQRRSAVALLALLALAASIASVFVFQLRNTALRQRDQAIYNQTIAEALQFGTSDPPLAAQLNLAAYRMHPTQDLASRLLSTENSPLSSPVAGGTSTVFSVAFSPVGHMLASGGIGGTVRLWDVADPAHPRLLSQPSTSSTGTVYSVAFSPNGHTLASGSSDGTIMLWNVTDPAHPRPLGQPLTSSTGSTVQSVAFSPHGHTLASGMYDGTIMLWNVADPAHPRLLSQSSTSSTGTVYSVAFSPVGHMLASGSSDGTIMLWNVADPAHPRPLGQPLIGGLNAIFSVAFSPVGHMLASGSSDGTIMLWNVADPAHPQPLALPLPGGPSAVESVAFSPNGHMLASGSYDGTIRLWNIGDPMQPRPLGQPLTSSTSTAFSVAFSPDGHTLASGVVGGTIRLWRLPSTVLTGTAAGVYSVAFSPNGHTLASGTYDDTVQLWNVADPAHPRPLGQPLNGGTGSAAIESVAFSPNGHTLASGNNGGTIMLWNVADPAHPRPLGQPLNGGPAGISSVAFSPDGHTLASGSYSGTVQLWNVADPAHPRPLGQPLNGGLQPLNGGPAGIWSVAFSPHGHTLASGSYSGTVQLWNVADPAHPRPLGQPLTYGTGAVFSVAFSPDGHTLASGRSDGRIRLWDVADPAHPRPLGQPLTGATGAVYSVAFSPHGHTLASGMYDGTIMLWNVADPARPRLLGQPLTGATGVVFSVAFRPDGHTLASSSYDGAVRLWNLNVDYAIERICATAGGLTPRQWHEYIYQLPYKPSCPH
jgi:WD40 repeat protein/uncharacterized protein YwlG (UPF0340 family)